MADGAEEDGSLHAPTLCCAKALESENARLGRLVDDFLATDADSNHLPAKGDVIGGVYEIGDELGHGAMGVVFVAFDLHLQRNVALKMVNAAALAPHLRQCFMREARAMAHVNHPNVLGIHAFGEHGTTPYFVMDLVEGQNVDTWLRACGNLPDLDVALAILSDVCEGVSAIHAAGTVHRDLKPSNVLLDKNLRARVADLGLAVSCVDDSRAREMAGTPEYMAPEISLDDGQPATALSDVYALGCLAYELLTGTLPFDAETTMGLLLQHQTAEPPLPSSRRSGLPAAFDQVILHALAKRPENRTRSADLLRRSLREACSSSVEPVRILVAEDDPDFRELLKVKLDLEFPDADVLCVDNGRALLDAFRERPASVVMVDLQMPVLDGMAVTGLLRARPDAANVPIIVLTASGGSGEWRLLSALGADRFLVKPVNLDDVVTAMRNALRERTSIPPSVEAVPR